MLLVVNDEVPPIVNTPASLILPPERAVKLPKMVMLGIAIAGILLILKLLMLPELVLKLNIPAILLAALFTLIEPPDPT